MFWKLAALSASSPVESILDKENFTLEELLDEEEIIQECKALNSRLLNFLRDRAQVEQLVRYVVEDAPEDADSKRAFKFPFVSCEIFTCEIDVILKTLVEEEDLMNLLFSFLEPHRPHSTLLAGYFSKVVICLMIRKTAQLMKYVQAHQNVFPRLVDLIGITSIMEVLVRLVGADDHVYPSCLDIMQWLADSDLLEMIVDKLSPSSPPEVHANTAETLCAITRSAPSALSTKLSSPSFVARIFNHALEDSYSKSGLVHSLSVCISLLDRRRFAVSSTLFYSFRSPNVFDSPIPVNQETISAMLPNLGDLLKLLNVSADANVLPTTYGELRPPLGKHRLKIVEFIAMLLKTGNEGAEKELGSSGTIRRILDLFFEYPYNNALHHHVESVIFSCLENEKDTMIDHILRDCNLIGKMLQTENSPILSGDNQHSVPTAGKQAPRSGNIGHITRISNKILQLASSNSRIAAYLQESSEWSDWQVNVLQERNAVENVYRWGCGRPTALQDRTRDSDEDELHERDYDVAALANNLNQVFRYNIYGNNDVEEDRGALDRDDEDVYFDDESAEVVISSLRLGDDQGSLFTNSNWFTFQDDRFGSTTPAPAASEIMDEINLNGNASGGNSSSDDEVVVGEDDELIEGKDSINNSLAPGPNRNSAVSPSGSDILAFQNEHSSSSNDQGFFRFNATENEGLFADRPLPEWVGWGESSNMQVTGSSTNPFVDQNDAATLAYQSDVAMTDVKPPLGEVSLQNGFSSPKEPNDAPLSSGGHRSPPVSPLFEDDVEFVGVEPEGTEKAMEQALREGIVGEAGPLKRNMVPSVADSKMSDDSGAGIKEFNDANYWRVDQEVAVLE